VSPWIRRFAETIGRLLARKHQMQELALTKQNDHRNQSGPFTGDGDMVQSAWTITNARAKFSELVAAARTSGPQTVTKSGRPMVVIVSVEEWEIRAPSRPNLAEFFTSSPLPASDLEVDRVSSAPWPS
jgi:prevent-host-death family protein